MEQVPCAWLAEKPVAHGAVLVLLERGAYGIAAAIWQEDLAQAILERHPQAVRTKRPMDPFLTIPGIVRRIKLDLRPYKYKPNHRARPVTESGLYVHSEKSHTRRKFWLGEKEERHERICVEGSSPNWKGGIEGAPLLGRSRWDRERFEQAEDLVRRGQEILAQAAAEGARPNTRRWACTSLGKSYLYDLRGSTGVCLVPCMMSGLQPISVDEAGCSHSDIGCRGQDFDAAVWAAYMAQAAVAFSGRSYTYRFTEPEPEAAFRNKVIDETRFLLCLSWSTDPNKGGAETFEVYGKDNTSPVARAVAEKMLALGLPTRYVAVDLYPWATGRYFQEAVTIRCRLRSPREARLVCGQETVARIGQAVGSVFSRFRREGCQVDGRRT